MPKLYYITHPSVAIDTTVNPAEWDLSDKGRREVKKLLEQEFWPEVERVITSSEPKSKTVGAMVSQTFGASVEACEALDEADRSETPFLPLEEYMQAVREAYRTPAVRVRGWESHHDMFARNKRALDRLLVEYAGQTIAIIGHGGAGTCVKCYIGNLPLSFEQDPHRTGCIFVADVGKRQIIQDWYAYC